MKAFRRTVAAAGLLFCASALCAGFAGAQEGNGVSGAEERLLRLTVSEQKLLRVRLRRDTGLSLEELDCMAPQINLALQLGGDGDAVLELLHVALRHGCSGRCLNTLLHTMNRSLVHGFSAEEARTLVCEALCERTRERARLALDDDDTQLCQCVMRRVERRMALLEHRRSAAEASGQPSP